MFNKFIAFIHRIKSALTAGFKLNNEDIKMLINILETFLKKERIYLYALLSLLGRKKPKKEEVEKFENIVNNAIKNILDGKEAFSESDKKEIVSFFKEMGLNEKQAVHFMINFTLARAYMLKEGINNYIYAMNKDEKKENEREKIA